MTKEIKITEQDLEENIDSYIENINKDPELRYIIHRDNKPIAVLTNREIVDKVRELIDTNESVRDYVETLKGRGNDTTN